MSEDVSYDVYVKSGVDSMGRGEFGEAVAHFVEQDNAVALKRRLEARGEISRIPEFCGGAGRAVYTKIVLGGLAAGFCMELAANRTVTLHTGFSSPPTTSGRVHKYAAGRIGQRVTKRVMNGPKKGRREWWGMSTQPGPYPLRDAA